MIKLTLQNRITSLLVASSIAFISIFTFIQLNIQIANINRYNKYRSSLSSIIVKNNLETILRQKDTRDLTYYAQASLDTLTASKIIEEAILFDESGLVIASADKQGIGQNVRYKDLSKIQSLGLLGEGEKWSISEIDSLRHRLNIYLPLKKEASGPILYVAKVSFPLGNIQEALSSVYQQAILAMILIIIANILLGYMLSKTVIGPVKILNEVTKIIASGDLSVRAAIHTEDELEELGSTFNFMAQELIKMKERAENANPLTKLPGNIVIREEVEKRIKNNQKLLVIYCDLDNFKAFNDKYGIAKGDEAIKLTADIFKEATKINGNPDDFVGHEGGDDFILLTTPDKAEAIPGYITKEFDLRIRGLYSQEDIQQGHIIAHARDGSIKQFPIMTISLAGVTNQYRAISSYAEVTNIAAELKKEAKKIESSVFILDRRRS